MTDPDKTPSPPPQSPGSRSAHRTLSSEQLFQGEREVLIQHGTELYRLRLTRQGKLILQK